MSKPRIPIVAALISRTHQEHFEVALFKRKSTDTGGGFWEFPGGKVERGESHEQALIREIQEELALDVQVGDILGRHDQEFETKILDLTVYHVVVPHFDWTLNDHDAFKWVRAANWSEHLIAPLDIPLLEQLFSAHSSKAR
ncbi:MAG: (deoxy)nucleoside triphosphate pyrophosphohydrolase [Bdellovibrio sp.]|jgi:8-oxo-dGTP diphosphatase